MIPGARPCQYPQQEHELKQYFDHLTTASDRTNTWQENGFADRSPENADPDKKQGGGTTFWFFLPKCKKIPFGATFSREFIKEIECLKTWILIYRAGGIGECICRSVL